MGMRHALIGKKEEEGVDAKRDLSSLWQFSPSPANGE
jgi:hypothetical protein